MTTDLGTPTTTDSSTETAPATTTAPAAGKPPARRKKRRWPLLVLAVGMTGAVVYLLSAYVPPSPATSRVPVVGWHYWILVAHIFTAAVAGLCGAVQFFPVLRGKHPKLHRWTGRAYFFAGVFPSTLLALPVAVLAPAGGSNQLGLIALDVMWAGTAIAGYRAARQRRFADHRRWMIRNYALTVSSPITRVITPLAVAWIVPQAGSMYHGDEQAIEFDVASTSVWLGVLVTIVAAEWYIQRRYGVPSAAAIARSRKS